MKKIFFVLSIIIYTFFITIDTNNLWAFDYNSSPFDKSITKIKQDYLWKNYTTDFTLSEISGDYTFWINWDIKDIKNLVINFDKKFNWTLKIQQKIDYRNSLNKLYFDEIEYWNNNSHGFKNYIKDDYLYKETSFHINNDTTFEIDFTEMLHHRYHNEETVDLTIQLIDSDNNSIILDQYYISTSNNKNFVYTNKFEKIDYEIPNTAIDNYFINFRILSLLENKNIFILEQLDTQKYQSLVKYIFSWTNRIIIDTQNNPELIKYLLWDNYQDYKQVAYYNKYLSSLDENVFNLNVFQKWENTYIKIPITWYKKWDIIINEYDPKIHHYFWKLSPTYYRKTSSYHENSWIIQRNNFKNHLTKEMSKRISKLSKVFTYLIISYVFILFGSLFLFFNWWNNRYKNIYIILWLSLIYLVIYYIFYIIYIWNDDKIHYVIDRQIYDNFEIQTHKINDFSVSNDNISFNKYDHNIFKRIASEQYFWNTIDYLWIKEEKQQLNYTQIPLNYKQMKFNSILFDTSRDFISQNTDEIKNTNINFKEYSSKKSLPYKHLKYSNENSQIFYDLYKSSDNIQYFLIETSY